MFPQFETSISRRQEVTFAKGEWFTCRLAQARTEGQALLSASASENITTTRNPPGL